MSLNATDLNLRLIRFDVSQDAPNAYICAEAEFSASTDDEAWQKLVGALGVPGGLHFVAGGKLWTGTVTSLEQRERPIERRVKAFVSRDLDYPS